ncbi:MAG: 1-phosphofructokinase family hexose kinase [Clostridia bacterium]|nr:1-phosphofructokinase family hexose kinase [Clostridia bacterium]
MITTIVLNPAVDKIYYIDDFRAGNLYRAQTVIKTAGGKGINVSRVASILGEKITTLGFKAGEAGRWLEAQAAGLGIDCIFIEVEGETRTTNNIIDKVRKTETEILETGIHVPREGTEKFMHELSSVLPRTTILVCTGSLPQGLPKDFYSTLIHAAKSHNVRVILDASNEALEEGIKAKPFLVKPNKRELAQYVSRPLNTIQDVVMACREITASGVEIVVASLGKEGAVMVSQDLAFISSIPDINVVNTIGSGDSLVAGLACGFLMGLPLQDSFRLGTACSLANTQFEEIGYIELDMVESFLQNISIKPI